MLRVDRKFGMARRLWLFMAGHFEDDLCRLQFEARSRHRINNLDGKLISADIEHAQISRARYNST